MHPAVKPAVFVASLLPLAWLVWGAVANTLGPNPAEADQQVDRLMSQARNEASLLKSDVSHLVSKKVLLLAFAGLMLIVGSLMLRARPL